MMSATLMVEVKLKICNRAGIVEDSTMRYRQSVGRGYVGRGYVGRGYVGRGFVGRGEAGLTFVEVLVSLMVFGIAMGGIYFGLIKTNEFSYMNRNNTAASETIRSLSELVLSVKYKPNEQDSIAEEDTGTDNQAELELLRLRETAVDEFLKIPGDVVRNGFSSENAQLPTWTGAQSHTPNVYTASTRNAFSLAHLSQYAGTSAATLNYNIPVFLPVDANRTDTAATDFENPFVMGGLTRTVAFFNGSLPVGGTVGTPILETGTNLGLRQVNLTLTYSYRGRTYTTNFTTFRAPTE